jgi:hypothetical protein
MWSICMLLPIQVRFFLSVVFPKSKLERAFHYDLWFWSMVFARSKKKPSKTQTRWLEVIDQRGISQNLNSCC